MIRELSHTKLLFSEYIKIFPYAADHARIQRGDRGSGHPPPPPLKNHKDIGFLSNTDPDLLNITKLPSQYCYNTFSNNVIFISF